MDHVQINVSVVLHDVADPKKALSHIESAMKGLATITPISWESQDYALLNGNGEIIAEADTATLVDLNGSGPEKDSEPTTQSGEVERLVALAEELGVSELTLDEAVIDAKLEEASDTNNGGFPRQIAYLIEAIGVDEVKKRIRDCRD